MAMIAAGAVAAASVSTAIATSLEVSSAAVVDLRAVQLSAYTGPAGRGVTGLKRWEQWSGVPAPVALDFADASNWHGVTGPDWQLLPWQAAGRQLIYSVPLFPQSQANPPDEAGSLRQCADGDYDGHWTRLSRNLVRQQIADTIIRPGWEFNGHWYPWAARGDEQAYIDCFQRLVTAMRAVQGQELTFLWNPSIGPGEMPAERAYPGNEFVDYIGIDVYDTIEWQDLVDGDHGLRFWSRYAADRQKPLAVPEWALTIRPNGHGGGDNTDFISGMLGFISDPANNVAFALYFDVDSPTEGRHQISAAGTAFPLGAQQFLTTMREHGRLSRRRKRPCSTAEPPA